MIAERRGDDDEVVFEGGVAPVGEVREPGRRAGRVGDLHGEALRRHELGEPAAHLAGAADDQRGAARARALRRDARLLLGS